jgi:transcriptional regulator with XRE-family HTH domain
MGNLITIEEIRAALKIQMDRKGIKGKPLAVLANLNESAVRDIFGKVDDPRVFTLLKLAHALEIPPATLFGGTVEIAGIIDGDGAIKPTDQLNGDKQRVARPPDIEGELLAYKVNGHGLLGYHEGDILFAARNHAGIKPSYIGYECVVEIAATGATLIRTIEAGSAPNLYNLHGFNRPTLRDRGLGWAAPILDVRRLRPD